MRPALYFLSLLGLLSACKVGMPTPTSVNFGGLSRNKDGKQGLQLHVGLNNPNSFGLRVKKLQFTLNLNGESLGRMEAPGTLRIKPRSDTSYPLHLTADLSGLKGGLTGLLTGRMQVQVKGSGKVKYFLFFGKSFDFSWP